jgi:hypothetical protein
MLRTLKVVLRSIKEIATKLPTNENHLNVRGLRLRLPCCLVEELEVETFPCTFRVADSTLGHVVHIYRQSLSWPEAIRYAPQALNHPPL